MNNKTTLQGYNAKLSANNNDLSSILETINNLPEAGGGITPSGEIPITANGTYDVTNYASANVNVTSGGGGDTSRETGLVARTLTEYSNDTATSIGENAFYNYSGLESANLPNVISIGETAFYNCNKLSILDFHKVTTIGHRAFRNCTSLKTFILRSETVCTIGVSAFQSTLIESGTGYIYVPDNLVNSYKSATNWSAYGDQIKGLGGTQTSNLFDGTKLSFTNGDKVTTTKNSITFDASNSSNSVYFTSENSASLGLKPNTTYSSRATVTIEEITSGGGTAGSMSGCLWLQKSQQYSPETKYNVLGNSNKTGVVYSQFTTPSDLTGYNYLVNRTTGYCKTKFENIVLLEGNYDSTNFPNV